MSKNIQENPLISQEKYGWGTLNKRRIFLEREGYIKVQKLDGLTTELHYSPKHCELSITSRDLPIEVLGIDNTLKNGAIVPQEVLDDMKNFVSMGKLGDFKVHHSLIVQPIDISRGIALTHPSLPGQIIYASGVGVFEHAPGNEQKLYLNEPDPSMTIRQFALRKGLKESMSTLIPTPEGEESSSDNNACLGAYKLGDLQELNYPANGKETLIRKIDQTKKLENELGDIFVAPHTIMYGAYKLIPDAGWFFYTLPETIEPLNLYKLGKELDKKTGQRQYLYELSAYQFLKSLIFIHGVKGIPGRETTPTFHGQPHMGNWKIVIDRSENHPPIAISDWGTSVDLHPYSKKRKNGDVSVYEKTIARDVNSAISAIVSAYYTDTNKFTPAIMEKISELISYCLAGYFPSIQPSKIMLYTKETFNKVAENKMLQLEKKGTHDHDPTKVIDSIISYFVPLAFFRLYNFVTNL